MKLTCAALLIALAAADNVRGRDLYRTDIMMPRQNDGGNAGGNAQQMNNGNAASENANENAMDNASSNSALLENVCVMPRSACDATEQLLATVYKGDMVAQGLRQIMEEQIFIGATTALLPEANDANVTNALIEDGMSGDTDFPHGNLKVLATMGETSMCGDSMGKKLVGVPDGAGAYLPDDNTVRIVSQSESYGPLRYESYPFPVNDGAATFGGSHLQYVDYDREMMSSFMTHDGPASDMVIGMGNMIDFAYNLKNEPVGPRNRDGPTETGVHYGNADADGNYAVLEEPAEADWFYQSFCSAHLEEPYQWGEGLGFEDYVFITNEEWMNWAPNASFVGIGVHAVDIETRTAYAVGAFTQGGFEKNVEVYTPSPNHVVIGISGYNGDFENYEVALNNRNMMYPRPDGTDYVWTNNINPFRFYIGVKGLMEDGSMAPEDDYLARNGLRYGQIYGFAIDMSEDGPTGGVWRDAFHADPETGRNGNMVEGMWMAQEWRWNGTVLNFEHDGSWEYQDMPPMAAMDDEFSNYFWWNAGGKNETGCKTEHLSPDVRAGTTAFVQGSTCGYFGHVYINGLESLLTSEAFSTELPASVPGTYYIYQGDLDVTGQIELGGAGQYTDGRDATRNWDSVDGEGKVTFEDIDGLELFMSNDGKMYVIIQEDSGNMLGERMLISSALEHEDDGEELTYYFVAMSGGDFNSRMMAGVGIPKGTNCGPDSHEFSGLFDLSGLLYKNEDGSFALQAADSGYMKRQMDAQVNINDKQILTNLQAHNMYCGIIEAFQTDRGGQWLMYQPNIPQE